MTALTWAIRLIIFVVLLVFAVQNTDPVSLRFFIVLLGFFVGGVVLGALSLLGVIFRQRREISRLKRSASALKPAATDVVVPPPL